MAHKMADRKGLCAGGGVAEDPQCAGPTVGMGAGREARPG